MSDTVIQVENLGKKYIIGHRQVGAYQYRALRDVITDGVQSLGQKIRNPRKAISSPNQEEFWALEDVSFEVKRGEVIGIIGRNGAGKSTLLKILSRITEPTTGRIRLKGRVASLLEVGTGFHPELTGRENIFLNGAILGMSKVEINRRFDEIVEFAEISRFLDTPVKRYSSGMYVRLAFAVAAHLEPEILVVDEVLAVGDIEFQKKCLGKIQTSSVNHGRTVLFVSHNMNAIAQLTQKCLFLRDGKKIKEGHSEELIKAYLSGFSDTTREQENLIFRKTSDSLDKNKEIEFCEINSNLDPDTQKLSIDIRYTVRSPRVKSVIAVRIDNSQGIPVATIRDTDLNPEVFNKTRGFYRAKFTIKVSFLLPDIYYLTFSLANMAGKRYEYLDRKLLFEIVTNQFDLTPGWSRDGIVVMNPIWEISQLSRLSL